MLRRCLCVCVCVFAASFHVHVSWRWRRWWWWWLWMGNKNTQQANTQHTTHEYTNRSIIFRLQFQFFLPFGSQFFWPTVSKQKYCGLIEAFFQLDHSLTFPLSTHTQWSQRKHINFTNCSDFKHFSLCLFQSSTLQLVLYMIYALSGPIPSIFVSHCEYECVLYVCVCLCVCRVTCCAC